MDRESQLGIGLEKLEPKRTTHPRGSLRLWAGAVFAGLVALACSQTVEAPLVSAQPDLLVTFANGTYRNIYNGKPDGLEVQITCSTGTTSFFAHELSRYYKQQPDNANPRGAYLAHGTYDDGKLKSFHLAMIPTKPSMFEGTIILDCYDNKRDETNVIVGRYQINVK